MASPYGGGERGVRRFSGAAGTIEVEDFKREFTMWCELQKSRNPNFNPYMVWKVLFGCLEGPRWQIMENLRLQTSLRL
jgi:hypothetical protein